MLLQTFSRVCCAFPHRICWQRSAFSSVIMFSATFASTGRKHFANGTGLLSFTRTSGRFLHIYHKANGTLWNSGLHPKHSSRPPLSWAGLPALHSPAEAREGQKGWKSLFLNTLLRKMTFLVHACGHGDGQSWRRDGHHWHLCAPCWGARPSHLNKSQKSFHATGPSQQGQQAQGHGGKDFAQSKQQQRLWGP